MTEDVLFTSEAAYLPQSQAMVMLSPPTPPAPATKSEAPAKTIPEPKPFLLNNIFPYVRWGDDNLFPQNINTLIEAHPELAALLDWKARAAHGKQVLPYIEVYDKEADTLKDKFVDDDEILSFLRSRQFKQYIRIAYINLFRFANIFPSFTKSVDGSKIVQLRCYDSSHCRWVEQNDKGVVPAVWITPNWGVINGMIDQKTAKIVDVLDPFNYFEVDRIRNATGIKEVIYPAYYPSPGHIYYQLATWDGYRTSGWLNYSLKIPIFKTALITNAMHIKYLVRVPTNYWQAKYTDWNSVDQPTKDLRKQQTLDDINSKLTNAANAGKSILNEVGFDDDGKPLPGWEIIVIDDKNRDGFLNEDSQESSAFLMRALQMDDSLLSKFPQNGMGAGSGSDKVAAFNLYCSLQEPYRDIVLEPLHFIAEYNGWKDKYPSLKFKTVEIQLTSPSLQAATQNKGLPQSKPQPDQQQQGQSSNTEQEAAGN